jgi:glutathione S-transferase
MTYPVLRISGDYAFVEVRKGRGAIRWRDMTPIHRGPASAGKEWKGAEGEKLAARHCLWPSDPNSTLSQPYEQSSWEGLGTGRPELLVFPTTLGAFAAKEVADPDDLEGDVDDTHILHEDPRSGNCYKIKLTAALLGLPLATRAYDIMKGETRTPEFLATVNANGRIPVLQIGEGSGARFLPESNAACWYLAHGSALIPAERFAQADMLRWMFFEQYNHEPNVATLRFWLRFVGESNLSAEQRAQIMAKRMAGCAALDLMNRHLASSAFFAGEAVTLADIALFAYTHVAEEGGFGLGDYPHILGWIARMQALPGFVTMD